MILIDRCQGVLIIGDFLTSVSRCLQKSATSVRKIQEILKCRIILELYLALEGIGFSLFFARVTIQSVGVLLLPSVHLLVSLAKRSLPPLEA